MRLAVRLVTIAVALLLGFRAVSAEENKAATQSGQQLDAQKLRDAKRQAIFREVAKSGAATIIAFPVSHSRHSWGLELDAVRDSLEAFYHPVYLVLPPHSHGWADLLDVAILVSTVAIQPYVQQLDEALFGRDTRYEAVLWDSPSLAQNCILLARVPELSTVLVYTSRTQDELCSLIGKVHVRGSLALERRDLAELDTHGSVSGIVVDRQERPVREGWVDMYTRSGRCIGHCELNDRGEFALQSVPRVPYRLYASGIRWPDSWFDVWLGDQPESPTSHPVDAKPGDTNVRIVLDLAAVPKKPTR